MLFPLHSIVHALSHKLVTERIFRNFLIFNRWNQIQLQILNTSWHLWINQLSDMLDSAIRWMILVQKDDVSAVALEWFGIMDVVYQLLFVYFVCSVLAPLECIISRHLFVLIHDFLSFLATNLVAGDWGKRPVWFGGTIFCLFGEDFFDWIPYVRFSTTDCSQWHNEDDFWRCHVATLD